MSGLNHSQSNLVFAPLVSHQQVLPLLQVLVQVVVLAGSLGMYLGGMRDVPLQGHQTSSRLTLILTLNFTCQTEIPKNTRQNELLLSTYYIHANG